MQTSHANTQNDFTETRINLAACERRYSLAKPTTFVFIAQFSADSGSYPPFYQ